MSTLIEVKGLTKQVAAPGRELTILADVDLNIREGERLAVVGESGSGKTTLLGLMAGLDVPSSGTVNIGGIDLASLDEDGRARLRGKMVGFVFQSFQLVDGLTALENVMLPLELAGRPEPVDTATRTLERVGLSERVGHYPRQLSGGEQQRVALARAFAVQPRILFADEPTGNLDQHTGQQVQQLLFALHAEHGTTLVLVTHDLSLARRCDRIVRLEQGRLQVEREAA